MKKTIFLAGLLVATLAGCDPCNDVECMNGGECIDGDCDCPEGYTGLDCSEQETPSTIKITAITITSFPQYDEFGDNWDVTDGPDVFITIMEGNEEVHRQTTMFENASAGSSYNYVLPSPVSITEPHLRHSIVLYDYDSFDSDLMGGVEFTPYTSDNGFPAAFTVTAGEFAFDIAVSYTW